MPTKPGLGAHFDKRGHPDQFGQVGRSSLGQCVPPIDDGNQRLNGEHPMHNVAGHLVGEKPDDGDVEQAAAYQVGHVRTAGVLDGDLDRWMPLVEGHQCPFDHRRRVAGATAEFSLMFALNAAGMIGLGLLNARLVRRFAVRTLLMVGLVGSSLAAVVLLIGVGTPAGASLGAIGVLLPLFVVVATRGLVSANATVLGVQRAPAAGAASAVLGACMFGGGILVSPLLALGGAGTALPMAAVVAGGAIAALLATALLTRAAARG